MRLVVLAAIATTTAAACIAKTRGSSAVVSTDGAPSGVQIEVDEFTGRRTMAARSFAYSERDRSQAVRLSLIVGGAGIDATTYLMVSSQSAAWRYLNCHAFHALANGTPVFVGEPDHDGRVTSHGVIEYVTVLLDVGDLVQIAESPSFRFRICRDTYSATPSLRRDARDIVDRLRADAEPSAAD